MPAMHDVVIIGGGPAGLYAGACLAAAGCQTALLEEHASVGEPVHCTGVLAADAFNEFNLSRRSLLNQLTTARFRSPAGHEVVYAGDRIEAVVIDRRAFDQDCSNARRRQGLPSIVARVSRACRLTPPASPSAPRRPSTARVRASSPAAPTMRCTARSGSRCRGSSFTPRNSSCRQAASATWSCISGRRSRQRDSGGWFRSSGLESTVRASASCATVTRRYIFSASPSAIASRWGIAPDALGRPRQKILPLAPISRTYGDRLLAIGDAAGLVKPTTGGGIYYSLVSAALAAETLVDAVSTNDLSASRLAVYEQRWRERLSAELQAQTRLRMLAHRMSDSDIEQLFDLARTDGVMPIVRRTASFNRHRKLILALLKHPPVRQLLLRRLAF